MEQLSSTKDRWVQCKVAESNGITGFNGTMRSIENIGPNGTTGPTGIAGIAMEQMEQCNWAKRNQCGQWHYSVRWNHWVQ